MNIYGNNNNNKEIKVAIQGVAGCFHDAAARDYFSPRGFDVSTLEFESFPDLFDGMRADASMLGIVAIENTIAGSLLANHELLRQSNLKIIGEIKKRIACNCSMLLKLNAGIAYPP